MLLAQLPSWLNSIDDWIYVLLILILPALGKFAQWIRDLQQGKTAKEDEVELTGELLEDEPISRKNVGGKNASLPQPFEPISSKSIRMDRVPPPPPQASPPPAKAWQPSTGRMETPTALPAKPKPPARSAPAVPVEAPRRPAPVQKQSPPRRVEVLDAPRESHHQKKAVREVVEMIARKPAPKPTATKANRGPSDSGSPRPKPTPPPTEHPSEMEPLASIGRLDRHALRRAFILREILDPPVSLR